MADKANRRTAVAAGPAIDEGQLVDDLTLHCLMRGWIGLLQPIVQTQKGGGVRRSTVRYHGWEAHCLRNPLGNTLLIDCLQACGHGRMNGRSRNPRRHPCGTYRTEAHHHNDERQHKPEDCTWKARH